VAPDLEGSVLTVFRERDAGPRLPLIAAAGGRDRARPRHRLVAVEHVELEVRQFLGQPTPIAVEGVAVVVVLGKSVLRELPRPLDHVRPLADGDDLHN
jgi:hypothetical protein